jgi:hypothetical protein
MSSLLATALAMDGSRLVRRDRRLIAHALGLMTRLVTIASTLRDARAIVERHA